jgi:predicted transposase/invertase (TIGR01784 family)
VYTVKQTFQEKPELLYDDRTHKVFYNCKAYEVADDEDLKGLMEFIQTNKATTDFSRTLEQNVKVAKQNTRWEEEYMYFCDVLEEEKEKVRRVAWKEGLAEGKAEGRAEGLNLGRAEGEHLKAVESAKNMLIMKLGTIEQIAQATGLSIEEVQNLSLEQ